MIRNETSRKPNKVLSDFLDHTDEAGLCMALAHDPIRRFIIKKQRTVQGTFVNVQGGTRLAQARLCIATFTNARVCSVRSLRAFWLCL